MAQASFSKKNVGFGDYYEVSQDGVLVCQIGRLITGTRVHAEWYYQLIGTKKVSRKKYPSPRAAWEAARSKIVPNQPN